MKEYNEQVVETLDDAGCIIANKNIIIDNLQARIAELEAENARLKAECDDIKQVQFPRKLEAVAVGWKKQLAADQLNNKLLREALLTCTGVVTKVGEGIVDIKQSYDAKLVLEALALPRDTSALDAYVAEKVNEALLPVADELQKTRLQMITDFGQYQESHEQIATLTRQRDLAVEALEKANDGIKAELSDNWTCNSYHPKLFAGEKAIDEAMSAIKESDGK